MATEKELRQTAANFLVPYIGCKEGGSQHKELIDIFNASGLCTRYKMQLTDAWCATAVSDCFIATGMTKIFPCVECSCANMISLAKSAKIWVEDDTYTPQIGDVIMYDWDDTTGSKSDNTGTPDHVGIVTSISGTSFQVLEGNKSNTVGYRSMTVNGSYIRGYITPDYASIASNEIVEGWKKDDNGWWWQNADGTYPAMCWRLIAESAHPDKYHWYCFGGSGYMLTGWVQWDSAAQKTGSGDWYYLEETGDLEGACYHEKPNGSGAVEIWTLNADGTTYTSSSATESTSSSSGVGPGY